MLNFDDEVVLVTGAGGGVGRAYALELARRGARVVVNDLGGAPDGSGGSAGPAEAVAREIRDAGGQAIANRDSVATEAGGLAMVKAGLDEWGRIDAVIHNAGILRDGTFGKLDRGDLDKVLGVHLFGAVNVGKPAFNAMKDGGRGGRLVFTSSSSGLYGNFGQSSYAIAKMAVVGLAHIVAIEGAKYNIKANVVAPTAGTRLTSGGDTSEEANFAPAKLAATGVVLAHRDCPSTGEVFQSGGGWVARVAVKMTAGGHVANGQDAAEDLFAHWHEVREGDWLEPKTAVELGGLMAQKLGLDKFSV